MLVSEKRQRSAHPRGSTAAYRLLDQHFLIRTDCAELLDLFQVMLAAFRVDETSGSETIYELWLSAGQAGRALLSGDGHQFEFNGSAPIITCVYSYVVNSILQKVTSHFLFHGASLAWGDAGLVLPAHAQHGKTTLVIELLKRGFRFLSDDLVAVNRDSGLLVPFPRSIGVRPGILHLHPELAGFHYFSLPLIMGGEKRVLDVRCIWPGQLAEACRPTHLILLSAAAHPQASEDVLTVVLSRVDDELLGELRALTGVNSVSQIASRPFPTLRIVRSQLVEPHIEEACRRRGVFIFELTKGHPATPCFQGQPRLQPLRKTEAARELLRHSRVGPASRLVREGYRGDLTRLFLDLLMLTERLDCYRLQVGRLSPMADLVCDLVR